MPRLSPTQKADCHGEEPSPSSLVAANRWLVDWQRKHAAKSVFRPSSRSNATIAGPQRVPRNVFHTVNANASEFVARSELLSAWRELNPEYDWHVFEEVDCTHFVDNIATATQRLTYRALATGAARADFFRILVLLYLGGVYADVDVQLRRPLHSVLDAEASMVLSPRLPFEWLISDANHPLMRAVVRGVETAVARQVRLWRTASDRKCDGPQQCVVETTGPIMFARILETCAALLGCLRPSLAFYPHFKTCANATHDVTRRTRVCRDEELISIFRRGIDRVIPSNATFRAIGIGAPRQRGWDCGAFYHRHCVTAQKAMPCAQGDVRAKSSHYRYSTKYFWA